AAFPLSCLSTASAARPAQFFAGSSGMFAASPVISRMTTPRPTPSSRRASIVSPRPWRATPSASNPGPRFAIDAGAKTLIHGALVAGSTISLLGVAAGQEPPGLEKLRVQDGGAGRSADRVVHQRLELQAQDPAAPDPPDGDRHAAARHPVEARLRAVGLVAHDDRALRKGREAEPGERGTELAEQPGRLLGRGALP